MLAAALPVTAATAGTDDGLLIVEGAGNSTGELVLRAPVHVDGAGTPSWGGPALTVVGVPAVAQVRDLLYTVEGYCRDEAEELRAVALVF